jgi:hypothetical protein
MRPQSSPMVRKSSCRRTDTGWRLEKPQHLLWEENGSPLSIAQNNVRITEYAPLTINNRKPYVRERR